jgi:hypothetical protein
VGDELTLLTGETFYTDNPTGVAMFSSNTYKLRVTSPFGYQRNNSWSPTVLRPIPSYHARSIRQTVALNNQLNQKYQAKIDAQEPRYCIWDDDPLSQPMERLGLDDKKRPVDDDASFDGQYGGETSGAPGPKEKTSRFSGFKKAMGIRSAEEKAAERASALREAILDEEQARWPDAQWWQIVAIYQDKVGMAKKIADLRARSPIQYLHLLKAGYFEPIPVAWAAQASNPLKFSIEAASGWRGITPSWRGYEDLAEERLYWVLNHREGSTGMRMKPDFMSEMSMAQARMARAVEPPPLYFSEDDTCRQQYASAGYSRQVMPAPFHAYDRPETPADDTMVLLDVSGSMDMKAYRPMYNEYLITGYATSDQPRNKDVARAIVRRFTDAMANHDHRSTGYDLVTFSSQSNYIGTINHQNLDQMWRKVRFGGGTRVMSGWQKVKELHFQKHSQSAIHHPVYGWQAGPETPMLRLLLLLDGEATDMDEFELDLLGLSWAHVTIFLIGVDGCPHHHRHANELQRISDVNHHVSFVDAQGNCPERFVTHELLKRHLGYDISMQEFQRMEELPAYSV